MSIYRHLNVEPKGFEIIMNLAVQGGIIAKPIDVGHFTNTNFATALTQ